VFENSMQTFDKPFFIIDQENFRYVAHCFYSQLMEFHFFKGR
jgi:hypothetical protein